MLIKFRVAIFFLFVCFGVYEAGILRWFDINFCQEKIKDIYGAWIFQEKWSEITKIDGELDYSWLNSADKPLLIAHALGASGAPGQNTLAEMNKSIYKGLSLMEIDLWLDENNVLRCHHGPDQPEKFKKGDCIFEDALALAVKSESWLILDIKTDFTKTGDFLVERVNSEQASRVIFQLYKPKHIEQFSKWNSTKPFGGPIVTLYLARRSVNHVYESVSPLGIRALTIPVQRLPALDNGHREVKVLTHPIHDCDAFLAAEKVGVEGFYVTSSIVAKNRSTCH
jgi:hypothetical protein